MTRFTKSSVTRHFLGWKLSKKQERIPVGYVPSATVAVCWWGGGEGRGCLVPGGVPAPGGWYPSLHWGRPPPPCGQTDRCKNITFATSLRMVINYVFLSSEDLETRLLHICSCKMYYKMLSQKSKTQKLVQIYPTFLVAPTVFTEYSRLWVMISQ